MKFNFKKIASVLATTVMLGSTVAFASAAWPAPFVSNGAADSAIVVGSSASASADDMAAATDLMTTLNAGVTTASSSGATVGGTGDKYLLGSKTSSTKLNLGDGIVIVQGTSITSDELPTMLASKSFYNKQNSEYKYSQKFVLDNATFTHFQDTDFQNKVPTLGFKINSGTEVGNYTLTFDTSPESSVSSDGSLSDLESKNVEFLGKNYYVLDFKNGSATTAKLTLLDSATSGLIAEGESKTLTVGSTSYTVKISFISDTKVILNVNGIDTESMSETGTTYGNTFKLADGTYVGIKSLNVQNYAGGTKNVEFSLGTGKLEITSGSAIKLNDKTEESIYGYITLSDATTAGKRLWDKIILKWKTDGRQFLAPGTELVMPGFKAIKLTMADNTRPAGEVTTVTYDSDTVINLKTTIKDGLVTIPILYFDTTTGNITGIGKDASNLLITNATTKLTYNATETSNRFVASWNNGKDSETYYLTAKVRYDSGNGKNYVAVKNTLTGDEKEKESNATNEQITFGNVVLTVASASYNSDGTKYATFTGCSDCSFNTLYTKSGMKVWLPFYNASGVGSVNFTANSSDNVYGYSAAYKLVMSEKDKNGDLAKKDFNLTLSSTGSTSKKSTVSDIAGDDTPLETASSSKMWESYVISDLATKFLWDKTNSDQYSVTIEAAGGEAYANVYVASPSVTTTAAGKIAVVKDNEVDAVKNMNLIVVGGSCINTLAASMLGSTTPLCGADFSAKTNVGAGQYLIQVAASPLNAAKVAMLIAGYDAADTTNAKNKVKEGTTSTDVHSEVGPTTA